MTTSEVLVCGAGPTGLMAACQLARRGIRVRLIDKGARFSNLSRALAVQARTLEIFAQMEIADEALRLGERIRGAILLAGTSRIQLEISGEGTSVTPYPFVLLLPQDQTERLLAEELKRHGASVEWNTELVSVKQDSSEVVAEVRTADGKLTAATAQYLIGADGAHSAVRHALGIPFVGGPYEHRFYLVDASAHSDLPRGYALVAPGKHSFQGLFPMPGGRRYRILGNIPDEYKNAPVTFALVQQILGKHLPVPVTLSEPTWVSEYRLHHRYATQFRRGRCFLGGDAAHIHSPAGGQGMNTGLQDAHNLAWKLAMVLRGTCAPQVLDSYEEERLPFAKELVSGTDRFFSMATSSKPWPRFFRTNLLPIGAAFVSRLVVVRRTAFKRVSQTGILYRKSMLTRTTGTSLTGRRLPYARLSDGRCSLDLITDDCFHLIVLGKQLPSDLREVPGLLRTHCLDPAREHELAKALGLTRGMVLVRPDQYIALASKQPPAAATTAAQVRSYFNRFAFRGSSGAEL